MKLPQDAVICIPSTTVFTRSEAKPFTTGSAETPPAFCRDTPVIRVNSVALSLVVLTTLFLTIAVNKVFFEDAFFTLPAGFEGYFLLDGTL